MRDGDDGSDDETEPMASIGGGDGSSEGRRWDGAEVDVAVVGFFVLRLTSSNLKKWRLVSDLKRFGVAGNGF